MKPQDPLLKYPKVGTPSPLKVDDLAKLHTGNRSMSPVKKLRASHHKIARLAAKGFTNKEVAAYTGYTRERVGQLLGAPAMVELVATYREKEAQREDEQLDPYFELATQNMIAAQRHIADKFADLDAEGELMPTREALAVQADAADRLGYAKRTNVNVNHSFAADMEKAIRRSGKVIDIKPDKVAGREPLRLASSPTKSTIEVAPPRLTIIRRA